MTRAVRRNRDHKIISDDFQHLDKTPKTLLTDDSKNFARQVICEILACGVKCNAHHSKIFVMSSNLVVHACKLLSVSCKFLHIAVMKLVKTVVERGDEQMTRYCGFDFIFGSNYDKVIFVGALQFPANRKSHCSFSHLDRVIDTPTLQAEETYHQRRFHPQLIQ